MLRVFFYQSDDVIADQLLWLAAGSTMSPAEHAAWGIVFRTSLGLDEDPRLGREARENQVNRPRLDMGEGGTDARLFT